MQKQVDIEYRIKAIDDVSATVDKVQASYTRLSRMQPYDLAPIYGRSEKALGRGLSNPGEQAARDEVSDRLRIARQVTRQAEAQQIADQRLFGQRMGQARGESERLAYERERFKQTAETRLASRTNSPGSFLGADKNLNSNLKLAMGGGSILIADLVGKQLAAATGKQLELNRALQSGAIDMAEYRWQMAQSITVLGGYIEAGHNLSSLIIESQTWKEMQAGGADRYKRDLEESKRYQDQRDARMKEENEKAKAAVVMRTDAERDATSNATLNRVTAYGTAERQIEDLEIARVQKIRELNKAQVEAEKTAGTAKADVQRSFALAREAAEKDSSEQIAKIRKDENDRIVKLQEESAQQIKDSQEATLSARLTFEGRGQEVEAMGIQRRLAASLKAIDEEKKHAAEAWGGTDSANQYLENSIYGPQRQAAEAKAAADLQQLRDQQARDAGDREKERHEKLMNERAALYAQELRATGEAGKADQLSRLESLREEMAAIAEEALQAKRQHAEDSAAIDKQSVERAANATERYRLNEQQKQDEEKARFKANSPTFNYLSGDTRGLTGVQSSTADPVLTEAQKTSKNTADTIKAIEKVANQLELLRNSLQFEVVGLD